MSTQREYIPTAHEAERHEHDQHAGHAASAAHAGHDQHADHIVHDQHDPHAGHAARSSQAAPADHAAHAGHDPHAGHSPGMFVRPFWISLILTLPIVIYAQLFQDLLGYTAPAFPGSEYLGLALGSVIYWYGGWLFLRGAAGELRARAPGMMTLVALAITTAYAYSVAITLGLLAGMDFYWELATLVTIMLLGHWMEMRAIGSAQSALNELAKLLPDTAELIVGGRSTTVPAAELRAGRPPPAPSPRARSWRR